MSTSYKNFVLNLYTNSRNGIAAVLVPKSLGMQFWCSILLDLI